MVTKVLDSLKTLSIVVFFSVLTYEVVDLSRFSKEVIADTQMQTLLRIDKLEADTFQELHSIRSDTFSYLNTTTNTVNNRIGSVQNAAFARIDSNAALIDKHITVALNDVNTHLNKVDTVLEVYGKLPDQIQTSLDSKFGTQTNCVINDLCWQNMTTDLLIDTRNVVRDGSKTFRSIDSNVPKMINDFNIVSSTVTQTLPPTAISIQKTADHIQKITTPHWYDRVLSYGISGGLLYFTAKK